MVTAIVRDKTKILRNSGPCYQDSWHTYPISRLTVLL